MSVKESFKIGGRNISCAGRVYLVPYLRLNNPAKIAEQGCSCVVANRLCTKCHHHPPALRINLSFAGCGFLGIYHLGVARALIMNGSRFMLNVQRYSGASAGSLVAAVLAVLGDDLKGIEKCTDFCLELAASTKLHRIGLLTPGADVLGPLSVFLTEHFPDDAHIIANDRLFISVTDRCTKKNEIVSKFSSKEELISYLVASSCVPHITGARSSVTVSGREFYDGGLTNNLPLFSDGRTIRISPFDGGQEICPKDLVTAGLFPWIPDWYMRIKKLDLRLNFHNLLRGVHTFIPPSAVVMQQYHNAGVSDTMRFLRTEGYCDSTSVSDMRKKQED